MTRMQKWQSYREEIAKHTMLGKETAADDISLQKYKMEIDKINLAILANDSTETPSAQKAVTNINVSKTEITSDIANMFATLNKTANTINQDTVESIFRVINDERIVDKNKRFIDQKLVASSKEYRWLKENTNNLSSSESHFHNEFKNELQMKYNNFTSTKGDHKVNPVISINKNAEKHTSHYVFVISISVSLLLLAIILSLFITKVVLR